MNKNEILKGWRICTFKICKCYIGKAVWLFCVLPIPLASENSKRDAVPCAQSKNVIREVDLNHFVIIIFRVAIKKTPSNHNKTNALLPPTICELNSPEIGKHLIPVTQIIVSLEWYQLLSITTQGLAAIVVNKPNPKVPFTFVGKVKSN